MSIEVASRVKDVSVISFEPQPRLALAIAISAELNKLDNVKVYEAMLGSKEGTARLYIPSHTIHASAAAREPNTREITCRLKNLDREIDAGRISPPNVIKIDVEGAELDVFRGAENLIRKGTPCIVFEADSNMRRFGYGRKDIHAYLTSLADYRFFYVGDRIYPSRDNVEDMGVSNIVAVPAGRDDFECI